jgi:catechol 2,3-dioxygenase-like lactoylglutathione lyase family enzyme
MFFIRKEDKTMIGYVTIGTRDLEKAAVFYDALAAELGTPRMFTTEKFIAWGLPDGAAGVGVGYPYDGNAMSVGNGVMVALQAKDKAQVDRLHALALSLGGTDEGAPGPRSDTF